MWRTPTTRHLVLGGAGLVGASTAATSAVSLYELAVLCGIPEPLSAALPIALDAGAGVAALVWITERGELRVWGRGVAIAALVATVAGNGIQHAIASGLLPVTLPLVLAVGACIPAMLFACVHLVALMTRPAQPKAASRPAGKPKAAAAEVPAAAPGGSVGKRAAGLAHARDNWPVTGKAVAMAVGVSKAEGDRIRAMVAAERSVAS